MKFTNKSMGNNFESSFCEILSEYGFWVHNMAANSSGQPADVIAAKEGKSYLIDCKVCANGKFPFSRVEENQNLAMSLWEDCGNGVGWFALLVDDFIYMIPHSVIKEYRKTQAGFNRDEILSVGLPIAMWATSNQPPESVGEQ